MAAGHDDGRALVLRIASRYRSELEDWLEFDEDPDCMVGQCLVASRELARRLRDAGFDARAVFGSYAEVRDGYAELVAARGDPCLEPHEEEDREDGTWLHWFVACGDLVVDVTADQFREFRERAEFRVVVTDVDDPAYRGVRPAGRARRR
jgi:hypothetical protein